MLSIRQGLPGNAGSVFIWNLVSSELQLLFTLVECWHTSVFCFTWILLYFHLFYFIDSDLWFTLTLLCCFYFSHIGPGHKGRVCITLEPAQLLKGDIMVFKKKKKNLKRLTFRVCAISSDCSNDNIYVCCFVD